VPFSSVPLEFQPLVSNGFVVRDLLSISDDVTRAAAQFLPLKKLFWLCAKSFPLPHHMSIPVFESILPPLLPPSTIFPFINGFLFALDVGFVQDGTRISLLQGSLFLFPEAPFLFNHNPLEPPL